MFYHSIDVCSLAWELKQLKLWLQCWLRFKKTLCLMPKTVHYCIITRNHKPRKSKDQTLPISSRESFTWIIPKTILCLVLDFQGKCNHYILLFDTYPTVQGTLSTCSFKALRWTLAAFRALLKVSSSSSVRTAPFTAPAVRSGDRALVFIPQCSAGFALQGRDQPR